MQNRNESIKANLIKLQQRIASACQRSGRKTSDVTLVAVTKGISAEAIKVAYDLGIRNFAENHIQEATVKIKQLDFLKPQVIWHMIGHLQSNKVKQFMQHFDLIHSVDSVKLALLLNRQMVKILPILLQVNISGEKSKTGFSLDSVAAAFNEISQMDKINVIGLMTIAPLVDDAEKARPIFRTLYQFGERLELEHLSMGMTDDFEVAIEEGSTMIRVGRAIFGERRTI